MNTTPNETPTEPQYVYVATYLSRPHITRFTVIKETSRQYAIEPQSGHALEGPRLGGYTVIRKTGDRVAQFVSTSLIDTYTWLYERSIEKTREARENLVRAEQHENTLLAKVSNMNYALDKAVVDE